MKTHKQPTIVERIAALLYEEATGDPWTVAGVDYLKLDRDYYLNLAHKITLIFSQEQQEGNKRRPYNNSGSLSEYGVFPECDAPGEDDAWCAECGVKLENVRPGKHQHPICSQAVFQQHATVVDEKR